MLESNGQFTNDIGKVAYHFGRIKGIQDITIWSFCTVGG